MRGSLYLFCVALMCALTLTTREALADAVEDADAYAESLVARAHELRLSESKEWLRLGHYRRKALGLRSDADGPDFFLAADGKRDPAAELDASLRGFFRPPTFTTGKVPSHPLCRFPARLAWLVTKLSIDRSRLRMPRCEKFEEYWKNASPHSATLVFSSFFISNPASAFGHTFLRINRELEPGATKREELLDHGIDYSARVDTSNAFLYGVKGLLGMFPGTFNMYPYYYKVREYNDFESRDLWEYDLDLTRQQVVMLAAHVWELGSTHLDYYYVDENCSYHILTALEAAVPGIDVTSKLRDVVIPADTVRAVQAQPGLVARIRYRPSLRHLFEARVRGISTDDLAVVSALARNTETQLSPELDDEQKIRLLDAAIDWNDIVWAKELVKESDSPGARSKQRLLERRAAITKPSADVVVPVPWQSAPHLSHGSGRITLASGLHASSGGAPIVEGSQGALRDSRFFYELSWRAAGHDLADPAPGQPSTSRLDFGSVTARLYPARRSLEGLELVDLTLVRIESLNPLGRFALKPSWKVSVAGSRIRDRACADDDCMVFGGGVGGGGALRLFGERVLAYALAETQVVGSGALDGIRGSPVRVDVGPSAGLRLQLGEALRAVVYGRVGYLPLSELSSTGSIVGSLRLRLGQDLALGFDGRVEPRASSAQVSAAFYY
jgi:hypothetical protein